MRGHINAQRANIIVTAQSITVVSDKSHPQIKEQKKYGWFTQTTVLNYSECGIMNYADQSLWGHPLKYLWVPHSLSCE